MYSMDLNIIYKVNAISFRVISIVFQLLFFYKKVNESFRIFQ